MDCRDHAAERKDTHIEVTLSSTDTAPKRRVIVEVSPRWREPMAAEGTDWSTATLLTKLKGHKVKFRGWMLFDKEHSDEAENTTPGRSGNWRATAWELHPVTNIEVVQ